MIEKRLWIVFQAGPNFIPRAKTPCSKSAATERMPAPESKSRKWCERTRIKHHLTLPVWRSTHIMNSVLSAFENKSFSSVRCDNEPSGSQVLTLEISVKPWIKADKYFSLLSLVAVGSLSLLELRSEIGIFFLCSLCMLLSFYLSSASSTNTVLTDWIVSC